MTQRASDSGYALVDTDGIDLDGYTGIHGFTIDTSDNTDPGFYAAGNDYTVVVASITADGQTVNFIAGRFGIENRSITADVWKWNGTSVPTPDTAGYPKVTIKDGTGTGELDTASGRVLSDVVYWNGSAVATPDTAGYPKTTVKSGAGTGEISLSSGQVTISTSGNGAIADAVWDEDITTHRAANSAGAVFQPIRSGTCQNGGDTTHVILDSGADSTNVDAYKYQIIAGWKTADGTNLF